MRFWDAARLGHKNLVANKRRSVMLIVIMGVLLGVIVALNLLVQGLYNMSRELGSTREDGGVILVTRESMRQETAGEATNAEVVLAQVRERIEKSGGEVLGARRMLTYKVDEAERTFLITPEEWLGTAVEVDLAEVPEGAVPMYLPLNFASSMWTINLPRSGKQVLAERVKILEEMLERGMGRMISYGSDAEEKFWVVGMRPAGLTGLEIPGNDLNPLNLLLGFVPGANNEMVTLVENGAVDWEREFPEVKVTELEEVVALFPDAETAYGYATMKGNCTMMLSCAEVTFEVDELYTNVLTVEAYQKIVQKVLGVVNGALWVVAVIVILFTVIRVLKKASRTAALYRALGATRGDVMKIFLCYVWELCVWTVVFAVVLGVGLDIVVCLINGEALKSVFSTGFGYVQNGVLIVMGWSWQLMGMLGAILLVAPMTILLTNRQFTNKRLMEKLK